LRILVVDDEKRMVESLRDYLALEGIEARTAGEGAEAERLLVEEPFDALVTDLRMPGVDGMSLLRWTREEGPALPVVMISAHGEVSDAVEAMKLGAYDYLVKPFDPDELIIRIRKAVAERQALNRLAAGRSRYDSGAKLVGESLAMKDVRRLIEKAAPSGATILLTGESGTGKEVAAQLVHELSGREGPFVPVNIGAVPENLLESELFGHEKGAFTGADSRRIGLFEAAQGGTLFLDEIGDLPLHLQVKLLRAIQERKIVRLGATKDIPVDARLVAATNRDLEVEVQGGRFREDLYYRINVIRIRLPPLRERTGDIGLLAGYFLKKLSGELGSKIQGASPEAMAYLESMSFPGNVRELENAIERALILAEGPRLEARDFSALGERSASKAPPSDPFAQPRSLAEVEKAAVVAALGRNAFHREKTAAELGITRRTLLNKIKEYRLEVPGRGDEE
jgi:two-component system, NtrC family, response regulator AtoC